MNFIDKHANTLSAFASGFKFIGVICAITAGVRHHFDVGFIVLIIAGVFFFIETILDRLDEVNDILKIANEHNANMEKQYYKVTDELQELRDFKSEHEWHNSIIKQPKKKGLFLCYKGWGDEFKLCEYDFKRKKFTNKGDVVKSTVNWTRVPSFFGTERFEN